jgi:flavorubredoxin
VTEVAHIADDTYVLSDLVPADGRVSWVSTDLSGHEPYNEYLVVGDEQALLIDTGVSLHGASILDRLIPLVGNRHLVIYISRIELDCIGNLALLLDHFESVEVATANPIPAVDLVHRSTTSSVSVTHFGFDQTLAPVGFPQMTVLDPVLRTLGTSWVFDCNARTLFSTDSFCGDLLETSSESVIRRSLDGAPDPPQLRRQTLAKFDWLARAETDLLRAHWDRLFAEVEPLALAPIHGRPAAGQTVVASMLRRYRDAIFGPALA